MDPQTLKKLNAARRAREACVLVTDLTEGRDRFVSGGDVSLIQGQLGEAIANALSTSKPITIEVGGSVFFINPFIPPIRIVVIGAVHISQSLVTIAKAAAFDVSIIDPRTAFASQLRFPDIELYPDWPEDILAKQPLDEYCALVALTHDPKIDDIPIKAALDAKCFYVGALGSRKTHAARVAKLKSMGVAEIEIGKIAAPIGLDIGASNPAEIAVAIMAQIILALRGEKGR